MTIEAVSSDIFFPGDVPATQQPDAGESSGFSDVLSRTSLGSNNIDLDAIFEAAGLRYNLSPNLLKAVAKAESGFRTYAVSPAGAMGIMQLMPGTAKGLGVSDPYDPEQNIMGGARYLRQLLDQFGDVSLALAAYNAGANNVTKYGGIPPFGETQSYVKTVLGYLGGGDITAGLVTYSGSSETKSTPGSFAFGDAYSQMLLMKIIEMQMESSDEDKDKKVF